MARKLGVPGLALFSGTMGLYLVYIGVKKVPFTEGLKALTQGQNPGALSQAGTSQSIRQSMTGTPSASGTDISGTVPISETTVVKGIRVHTSIAKTVTKMVEDASRQGIKLSGGGWRSSAQQAALRLKNGCTCSDSSSCCKTPTAPVGRSMHEKGLAIDFDNCRTKDTAVFQWLNRNASRYGLKNLPGEPWHWSTNGN